ncbi:MAG: hypothetical protein ACYS0D_09265, partial [Planctomycetota bacterium]
DAVFPATIVGPPPQEDYYLGKATERIFLPLLKVLIPDIEDYHLPLFGCFHNCAFMRIRKAYPLQARRVMHAVWGAGQMAWEKYLVVVDGEVDIHDEAQVLAALCANCRFDRDLEAVRGPLDILDHAAARLGAGGKLGFDATVKVPGEEVGGIDLGPRSGGTDRSDEVAALGRGLAGAENITGITAPAFGRGRLVFVGVAKSEPGQGERAIRRVWSDAAEGVGELVVAVDVSVALEDWEQVLFHFCANTDPARDLIRSGPRIGFDATPKHPGDERNGEPVRAWPPIIAMTEAVREQVSRRWAEYGFGE